MTVFSSEFGQPMQKGQFATNIAISRVDPKVLKQFYTVSEQKAHKIKKTI